MKKADKTRTPIEISGMTDEQSWLAHAALDALLVESIFSLGGGWQAHLPEIEFPELHAWP